MTRSGVETTGRRDELTIMEHALQRSPRVVVALQAELGEGASIQGGLALVQGEQQFLTLLGEAGGIGLVIGVILGAQPEQGGKLLSVGVDAESQRGWSGTEAVFAAVQQQGVLAMVGRVRQQEQTTARGGQDRIANSGGAERTGIGELGPGGRADGTKQEDGTVGAL